jgi:hypothetical protein
MDWPSIASSFHVMAARDLLATERMERHQDVRGRRRWLTAEESPLALLFDSHRWETLEHPDPGGRQLRAVQAFLRRVVACVEALCVGKEERLRLAPRLDDEGTLQAVEVGRRMLGFGPFAADLAALGRDGARKVIEAEIEKHRSPDGAFGDWLLGRIGLWLDYSCMPQKPLSSEDVPEFRRSLEALDGLVASSTVIALRQSGDDYAVRGWCASEFFLASGRSFARGLVLDVDRLDTARPVAVAPAPAPAVASATATAVMREAYEGDLAAFRQARDEWASCDGPFSRSTPPDGWSAYRSLQGSGFFAPGQDPNPFRRALDAIRELETTLIESWWLSGEPHTIDLGSLVSDTLTRRGLHCRESTDLAYLGLLLPCHGWIDGLRTLFRECLGRYVGGVLAERLGDPVDGRPILTITLHPLPEEVRALLLGIAPNSAATWHSRLSSRTGLGREEKAVADQFRRALEADPPRFVIEPACSPAGDGLRPGPNP